MPERIDITAQTKVAELLKDYPELEQALIEQAPMFAKIQNPVLQKLSYSRFSSLDFYSNFQNRRCRVSNGKDRTAS